MSKQQPEQNPKLPPKRGRPVDAEKDRVTVHISVDMRGQIEKLIPDMGKSLSMVVRNLVNLGLELVGLSQKGLTAPRSGNLEEWLASYTSLGTELLIACETLNLSAPKPGQIAIWLLDKMAFGSNDPQIINDEEDTSTTLLERIRLGKKLQTFSFEQGIELPQNEEFATWLGQLYANAVIGQEFVAACRTLDLQLPETGELQEWLQDLVVRSRSLSASAVESQLSNELVEECERLGIDPPKAGEVAAWLQNTRPAVFEQPMHEHRLPFTDDGLPLGGSQPFLEHLLTLNAPPTEDEEYDIAHRFGVDPAHLKELISRMRFDRNGQTNNCH
ncbi:hypothetical protein [Nostoc favosum]|uniref:Uncharacterized protein n=1 Tax=Nostoc favosum CHAB5714 TaxID=2780399 RepID=A0ABS8I6D8_9NOSO|nr:hypothetical protein [Nostoc favosum]MCC5599750.1 hypothetical protein [Nostoc favosum CHAB5714]